MPFRLHVTGPRACFRRPEFRTDLVSYDTITPVAARGIFESIHWTPAIRWQVERIQVLKPIRLRWSQANEALSRPLFRSVDDIQRDDHRTYHLVDVSYVLTAHFHMTSEAGLKDSASQHARMFLRRAHRRQFFKQPFLGLREYPAGVELLDKEASLQSDAGVGSPPLDLGWMLYDTHFGGQPDTRYFRAMLVEGGILVPPPDSDALAG